MADNLTPKQRKTIGSLLETGNVAQAAQTAGISRDTIYRWMREDDFKAALKNATQETMESLSRSLVTLGTKAAQVLENALDDEELTPAVRLRAVDIAFNRLLQLRELVELEARVSRLEAAQNGKKN